LLFRDEQWRTNETPSTLIFDENQQVIDKIKRGVIFEYWQKTQPVMNKSTPSVLLIVVLILTFPIWIGLLGGAIGLVAGFFGLVIGLFAGGVGLVAGIFGGIVGGIASIFSWIFGWHVEGDFHPFFFVFNPFLLFAVAVLIAIALRKRKQTVR